MSWATAWLAVAFLAMSAAPAHAEEPGKIAANVHREGGYPDRIRVGNGYGGQSFDYPAGGGGPGRARTPPSPQAPRPRAQGVPVPAGGSGLSMVLFIVIAIVVAVAVIAIVLSLRPKYPELPQSTPRKIKRAEKAIAEDRFDLPISTMHPDALAAQGRFAEAIGAALVTGLRAAGWTPEGLGKSRTAREIVSSVQRPDQRQLLDALLSIEERVIFGGASADESTWQRARELWAPLTAAVIR